MALINCPECNHQVSSQATKCPNCAFQIKKTKPSSAGIYTFGIFNFVMLLLLIFNFVETQKVNRMESGFAAAAALADLGIALILLIIVWVIGAIIIGSFVFLRK